MLLSCLRPQAMTSILVEYEAARTTISTSKSLVVILSQKRVEYPQIVAAPSGGVVISWDLVHELRDSGPVEWRMD